MTAGLTDNTGWRPVDPRPFESTWHKNVHVIGEAIHARSWFRNITSDMLA